ncbi:hypothetical protein DL546_002626 [Coniochaeta pulveracea]|uniref:Uncharacterized protein n=1 Tax=Coniochaeta pulveracea TaxID=177199 RepID=A0A420Y610_9PEZI|nr:hypothetical protein DL546_002626 [Coniochaeta pulveracea]
MLHLWEEEVTVHVAYHGNECKGRCADKEAEEAETFSAELYRQHMKDWNKVKMEVQKEDARKRRKIQKQYIADCVEAMKNAPKRAEAAHREQEEKLEGAREELRRIEEWQTWVEEEARWLEDKLQTMGAPQSLG